MLYRYVGCDSVHLYIRPCLLHGLYDQDPLIVERTLASLATLCELGLYLEEDMKEMAADTAALVCDPSHTTRLSAVALFAAIGANLDPVMIKLRCSKS